MKKILVFCSVALSFFYICGKSSDPFHGFTPMGRGEALGTMVGLAGEGVYEGGKAIGKGLSSLGEKIFQSGDTIVQSCLIIYDTDAKDKKGKALPLEVQEAVLPIKTTKLNTGDHIQINTPFRLYIPEGESQINSWVKDCPAGVLKTSDVIKDLKSSKKKTCTLLNDLADIKDKNGNSLGVSIMKLGELPIRDIVVEPGKEIEMPIPCLVKLSDGRKMIVKQCLGGRALVSVLFQLPTREQVKAEQVKSEQASDRRKEFFKGFNTFKEGLKK